MGLFSNRKKEDKNKREETEESTGSQSQQHSAPEPSGHRKGNASPGGLLPKPGWDEKINKTNSLSDSQIPPTTPSGSNPNQNQVKPKLGVPVSKSEQQPSQQPPPQKSQSPSNPYQQNEPKQSMPGKGPAVDKTNLPPTVPSHPSEQQRGSAKQSQEQSAPKTNPPSKSSPPQSNVPSSQQKGKTPVSSNAPTEEIKTAPTAAGDSEKFSKVEKKGTVLEKLLMQAVEQGASDLHISRGVPPTIRLDGYLMPLDFPKLSKADCKNLIYSALNDLQREKFEDALELDFSVDLPDAGRFRVNIHKQRGVTEGAFRVVNDVILPLRRLGLPGVVEEIARKFTGLILVTGPTGSGKTTTLASIVDQINSERQCMVVTVEDPIEYVHQNKRSIIKQREVMSDTHNFPTALRHVLRQDPDVIVIGEMRDLETISTALTAAETGHLVFATLHTPDASQTIDRIIDVFPPHQQEQTRIQLANTLQSIIAQQLIPVPGNRGRVVAVEVLIATTAVRKIVRTGKTEQLYTTMQTNWESGMITMDKSLKTLYQQGLISFDDALARCKFPHDFDNI